VLPVATHAFLYHTVSGITLLRYYRLCREYDAPLEQRVVVEKMVRAVLARLRNDEQFRVRRCSVLSSQRSLRASRVPIRP
jgi:hypothetical protein